MADDSFVSLHFDGDSFIDLGHKLHMAADEFELEMTPTLALVAKGVEAAAKAEAGKHSSAVAGTIRSHTVPGAAVVEAGNPDVPIATLWELGNKGSKRSAKTFRHPVFGHPIYVNQPKFPYLAPALKLARRDVTRLLDAGWKRVLEKIGSEQSDE